MVPLRPLLERLLFTCLSWGTHCLIPQRSHLRPLGRLCSVSPSLGGFYLFGFEIGSHVMAQAGLRFKGTSNLPSATARGPGTIAVVHSAWLCRPSSLQPSHMTKLYSLTVLPRQWDPGGERGRKPVSMTVSGMYPHTPKFSRSHWRVWSSE